MTFVKSQLVQGTFDGLGIFLCKKTYLDLNPFSNLTTSCLFLSAIPCNRKRTGTINAFSQCHQQIFNWGLKQYVLCTACSLKLVITPFMTQVTVSFQSSLFKISFWIREKQSLMNRTIHYTLNTLTTNYQNLHEFNQRSSFCLFSSLFNT